MATLNQTNIKTLLHGFQFVTLFNELNWDNPIRDVSVTVGDESFLLKAIAEKRGVQIFQCSPTAAGTIPDYATRKKIDHELSKSVREHLIIFTDAAPPRQIWQWTLREQGKPPLLREYESVPLILQKLSGISFSLDDEEGLTLLGVTYRLKDAFDKERLTKKFYDAFGKEQQAFLKFIDGIDDGDLQQWYASVMISRLMFIYFIQEKDFLDGNPQYLSTKLRESVKRGKDKFYRHFLITLFFDGFAKKDRPPLIQDVLGDVPYLNGGLFNKHDIEQRYGNKIHIPDAAFERLFAFFDEWRWHLDERPIADGKHINPDVLGYIFEKYVNNKQMGAYYTKEDITGYISEFSILPFIYDKMNSLSQEAAQKDGQALLMGAGDAGSLGLSAWGVLPNPNDFITQNKSLQNDLLQRIADTDSLQFIHRLYFQVIKPLKVLDPTCGSGAFLFAAIKLLLPLYNALVGRMRQLAGELDRSKLSAERKALVKELDEELERITHHASEDYFILKTIILNNLHGVDIVEEATEICKLRLFLKLMATVERKEQLEPLPDIDFNIKAGNSLVGFATFEQMSRQFENPMGLKADEETRAELLTKYITTFQAEMLTSETLTKGSSPSVAPETKTKILALLRELQANLDKKLHSRYKTQVKDFKTFKKQYQPFHWCIDFAGILARGGFDVIIGNPPYVEYSKVKTDYTIFEGDYDTFKCGNLYAYCMERSYKLLREDGRFGMIVPNSSISAGKMSQLQKIIIDNHIVWVSNYAWRPAKLFEGADMLLAIILSGQNNNAQVYSTKYHKWYNEERGSLFKNLHYLNATKLVIEGSIPKLPSLLFQDIHFKMTNKTNGEFLSNHFKEKSKHFIYTFRAVQYWVKILDFEPTYTIDGKKAETTEMKTIYFQDESVKYIAAAFMSSSLFFVYYIIYSSCQVINARDFDVPFSLLNMSQKTKKELEELGRDLMKDFRDNSEIVERDYKGGFKMKKQHFYIKKSKSIIDEIDAVLAEHYGFTAAELAFIINYDIKYRMGKGSEEEE